MSAQLGKSLRVTGPSGFPVLRETEEFLAQILSEEYDDEAA